MTSAQLLAEGAVARQRRVARRHQVAEAGEEGPCGWLKDKFGLSWQVIPRALPQMLMDENSEKAQRVMKSMLQMRKVLGISHGLLGIDHRQNKCVRSVCAAMQTPAVLNFPCLLSSFFSDWATDFPLITRNRP